MISARKGTKYEIKDAGTDPHGSEQLSGSPGQNSNCREQFIARWGLICPQISLAWICCPGRLQPHKRLWLFMRLSQVLSHILEEGSKGGSNHFCTFVVR